MSNNKHINNNQEEIKDNIQVFDNLYAENEYDSDNDYDLDESIAYNQHYRKFNFIRIVSIVIASIIILASIFSYQAYQYKSLMYNFKESFDSSNYAEANNYILTSENFNIFKSILLKNDLESYFKEKIIDIRDKVNSNQLSSTDALAIIDEINRYSILNIDSEDSAYILSDEFDLYTDPLSKGISEFEQGKYEDAITTLNKISSTDKEYKDAKDYINKSKSKLKEEILNTAENYKKKEYFTAAINLIESKLNMLSNDKDLVEKISELKDARTEYLASQKSSEAPTTSSQLVSSINTANINALDIESLTDYLIYVDTNSQTTNIYTGSKNKWSLKKSMKCSTGIENKETPSGVYTVQNRDEWFFSEKYNQGGKYWVQFDGDYLFHSLPYARDQQTVLDETLGTPASHGCVRLSLEDSKWLYDNITKDTKVIIK